MTAAPTLRRAGLLAGLGLCLAVSACGGSTSGSPSSQAPSSAAPTSPPSSSSAAPSAPSAPSSSDAPQPSATETSSPVASGPATVTTDFSDSSNPDGWPTGDIGGAGRAAFVTGGYAIVGQPKSDRYLTPRSLRRATASNVSMYIDPARFDPNANLGVALACRIQRNSSGNITSAYSLGYQGNGRVSILKLVNGKFTRLVVAKKIPGYVRTNPPKLGFACIDSGGAAGFAVIGSGGKTLLSAADAKSPLPAGGVALEVFSYRKLGYVTLTSVSVTLNAGG